MIYTTNYINKVLSHAYQSMGDNGDVINMKLMTGLKYECLEDDFETLFLLTFALNSWSQDSAGINPSTTNSITLEQRDKIIDYITANCPGFNESTQTIITVSDNYWIEGYADPDYTT